MAKRAVLASGTPPFRRPLPFGQAAAAADVAAFLVSPASQQQNQVRPWEACQQSSDDVVDRRIGRWWMAAAELLSPPLGATPATKHGVAATMRVLASGDGAGVATERCGGGRAGISGDVARLPSTIARGIRWRRGWFGGGRCAGDGGLAALGQRWWAAAMAGTSSTDHSPLLDCRRSGDGGGRRLRSGLSSTDHSPLLDWRRSSDGGGRRLRS
nr:hypothetical protein Iba_scaffold3832CG0030 [Ipomoea batatas]